jgi:threonylcarbamoyladenosine tRNA methylthiotransferase MtaB
MRTVAIETHGCKLNQADSGTLFTQFADAGYRVVPSSEPADVYVVNSCTVTHVADRKARQALRAARRRSPGGMIVATGCYAERSHESLAAMGEVDLVVGNPGKDDLVRRVAEWMGEPMGQGGYELAYSGASVTRNRAMVKIQQGCDQVCAYCIVPKVRGRERSIPQADLVSLINEHASRGCKEVVLTGTQLGSYGFDIPDASLTTMLSGLLRDTKVPRLRVSSLQAQEIDGDLLALWADPRLCRHFHLALQSGSDAVLAQMRRRYDASGYLDAVERIRETVPGASITTDIIVGFPGESDADFQQTLDLCEQVGFAAVHAFPYSVRPGTSAAYLKDRVDSETKAARMKTLLEATKRHAAAYRAGIVGETRSVLWEGRRARTRGEVWSGLTGDYIRVVAPSPTPLANEITGVRLVGQEDEVMLAEVAPDIEPATTSL